MNVGVYVENKNADRIDITHDILCEGSYKHGDIVLVLDRSMRCGMYDEIIDVVHVLHKGKKTLIINKLNWQFFEEIT